MLKKIKPRGKYFITVRDTTNIMFAIFYSKKIIFYKKFNFFLLYLDVHFFDAFVILMDIKIFFDSLEKNKDKAKELDEKFFDVCKVDNDLKNSCYILQKSMKKKIRYLKNRVFSYDVLNGI